jgi:RNA polymerase sigma-70 factor (ECF subfamily)
MNDISEELVSRAAKGDQEAFKEIYDMTKGLVYNVALRVTGNREDAQEVAQEVFVNVYHKIGSFRFQSSFRTWIYRVTSNHAINWAKRESRLRRKNVTYEEEMHAGAAPDLPQSEEEKAFLADKAQKILESLPPDQRACVVLRNMEGLSYEAIAQALNININTVRSRLNRAREKLLAMAKGVVYE